MPSLHVEVRDDEIIVESQGHLPLRPPQARRATSAHREGHTKGQLRFFGSSVAGGEREGARVGLDRVGEL